MTGSYLITFHTNPQTNRLLFKVFLNRGYIHRARYVFFVSWEGIRVDRPEERLDPRYGTHPCKCMSQKSAELIHVQETHGTRPRLHVFRSHDEDTFWTNPILNRRVIKLDALRWGFSLKYM